MVRKDWEGTVESVLEGDALIAAGFHPKRSDRVFKVLFDEWAQTIAVPTTNLVILDDDPGA